MDIPDGSRLLAQSAADPVSGENLGMPGCIGRERLGYLRGGPDAKFLAEVAATNRVHPGIEDRIYTLDRSFDMLRNLLSEERRRGEFDGADWGTTAIFGGNRLPEHLSAHGVTRPASRPTARSARWPPNSRG